jgi:hypothetical protein
VVVVDLGAGSLGRTAASAADRVVPELAELIDPKLT